MQRNGKQYVKTCNTYRWRPLESSSVTVTIRTDTTTPVSALWGGVK
jgi:hypothetical protein